MENKTVLVLEDVDAVRSRIIELLADLDIDHLFEASSTQSAVQIVELHHPMVAILDIQVPGTSTLKNGIDVLRWICKTHKQIAVIMLTNHDQPVYRTTCLALGAVHFFDKSGDFEKLHDAVAVLLA